MHNKIVLEPKNLTDSTSGFRFAFRLIYTRVEAAAVNDVSKIGLLHWLAISGSSRGKSSYTVRKLEYLPCSPITASFE